MSSVAVNKTRLLIVSYLPFRRDYPGGGWVDSFVRTLSSTGEYELGVMYVTESKQRDALADGVRYFPVYAPVSRIDKLRSILFHRPKQVRDIQRVNTIVNEFQPDIIVLFGMETSAGTLVSHVKDIPVIVHLQGILSEYINYWFPRGINPYSLASYSPFKMRLHRHTTLDFFKEACKRAKYEKKLFKKFKYYFGRTDWDHGCLMKYNHDAFYMSCDELLRREFYKRQWEGTDGSLVITTVCNGEIYKGYDNILKTASILKQRGVECEWNVYGVSGDNMMVRLFEGEMKDSFSSNNVFFRGKKSASELADILSRTSVYVHPSHIDNSPNSVCEAMLVGVPVIAMNVGGLSTIIDNGHNGFLVEDYDCNTLADRIILLSEDDNLSCRLSEKARATAQKRHSEAHILEQLQDAFAKLITR